MSLSEDEIGLVTGAIASDLIATLGWPFSMAIRYIQDAGSLEDFAAHADDRLTLAFQVMTNVQEAIQEDGVDREWPRCPLHRQHALSFVYDLLWRCPSDLEGEETRGVPIGWLSAVVVTPEGIADSG